MAGGDHTLFLTPGEPAGIGPELAIKAGLENDGIPLVAIADKSLLAAVAHSLALPIKLTDWTPGTERSSGPGKLAVWDTPLETAATAGLLDPTNAAYVLKTLERGIGACLSDPDRNALVTGPVHKGVINDAGIPFTGHTELLAQRSAAGKVVMMLASKRLRVALATTHLPLRHVADTINRALVLETLEIVHRELKNRFAIAHPRIAVCGLNPHAGEGGHLGDEDQREIRPAIESALAKGILADGPWPADTLFTAKHLQKTDVVLAMYHDQGLPVLKYEGFGAAVNITLGLPFVRTSVDHGTATDIAGRGIADSGSMMHAIRTAYRMLS